MFSENKGERIISFQAGPNIAGSWKNHPARLGDCMGDSFLYFDLDFDNFVINQTNESHDFSL
jgi:hypothetical protein